MEIAPGIHHIQKARGPNVYLLVDQDLTLIDTGYPGNGRIVVEYIEGLGRQVGELKRMLYEKSLHRIAELDFDIACLAHGQVFQGNASQCIRRMLDWYFRTPMWLRLLRAPTRMFPLGRQTGFRNL